MNAQEVIKILDKLMRSEELDYDTEATDALHYAIEHMKRGAPEGWQLVPKEPTEAIIDAIVCAPNGTLERETAYLDYKVILSVAPKFKIPTVDDITTK